MIFKISFFLFLLSGILFANLQEKIEYSCPKEYAMHKETISKYLIRMEDDITDKGCKVIPVYASIIQSENFDILDALEDSSNLMDNLMKLFYIKDNLSSFIFKNTTFKTIVLNNSMNDKFVERFSYLLKKSLHKKDLRKIDKDENYLNYYILSASYSKNKKDTVRFYKKIKKSISLELIPSFTLILSAIGDEYKFEELLENFTTIQKELSKDAIKTLSSYPKYFVYLLYPTKVDLDLGIISKDGLKRVQKDIQKKALFLYKSMFEKYRYAKDIKQIDYALLSVAYIYPYLLEQSDVEYDDFTSSFNRLIEKGYLLSLFADDKCSNKTRENFAIFGNNNIYSVSKFLKKESLLANQLFQKLGNSPNAIFPFFYVANFYSSSNSHEWYLFKNLLKSLPFKYEHKIAFLKRLEKNGYFRNIVTQSDYKSTVKAEDSSYPKYKYILVTPYPSQNDSTLFEQILTTNISDEKLKESLLELIKKNTDELANHRFTTFDKINHGLEIVDNIDNGLIIASIAAAPFTGGMSLSYVAIAVSKKATQKGAKTGVKYMAEKVALKGRKMLNKGIGKIRKGRKVIDNKIGSKNRNLAGKAFDSQPVKVIEHLGEASAIIGIGTGLYLYFNHTQLEGKTICLEQ